MLLGAYDPNRDYCGLICLLCACKSCSIIKSHCSSTLPADGIWVSFNVSIFQVASSAFSWSVDSEHRRKPRYSKYMVVASMLDVPSSPHDIHIGED